jgi:hypothetical protein
VTELGSFLLVCEELAVLVVEQADVANIVLVGIEDLAVDS